MTPISRMTPEEVGARLVATLDADDAVATVSGGGTGHARATVDVPPACWHAALGAARDDAGLSCDFFDWLSAVDELDEGFTVVAHLWSTRHRIGVLVRTRVPRDAAVVESVVDLYPGAGWHERETYEMFGIGFDRHPGLRPLLLPPGFEGNPLRKEFVLASRVAKPWPGAKEPGESGHGTAKRAPMRPPGVPDPTEWGPAARKAGAPAGNAAPDGPAGNAAPDGVAAPAGNAAPAANAAPDGEDG